MPIIVAAEKPAYGVGKLMLYTFLNGKEEAMIHASQTLISAEKRYGQVEKEALASFHSTTFPYGR